MRTAFRLLMMLALALCFAGAFWAQQSGPAPASGQDLNTVYICPMDPDVRSHTPGTCPRCGMKLAAGIPDPVEFHMDVKVTPRPPQPGQKVDVAFSVHDPWKDRPVVNFQVVHEKIFHMFVVSQDLQFFLHEHPTLMPDGDFHYQLAFPKPGMYRVIGDFYPDGATPQLLPRTVFVPGKPPEPARLTRDYAPKDTENMQVELVTEPAEPIAGMNTQMYFRIKPGEGLEKLLGAWGHMLVASDDLIDLVHTHPFIADGGPQVQFNMVFPRVRNYRVWVQFQRKGMVNTAHFDIPVKELR
jgi:hypothetical protein